MDYNHKHYHRPANSGSWWSTPHGLIALLFLAGIGYFLITEHMAHVIEYLPYLIILACPLMHIFMHHGHGHSSEEAPKQKPVATAERQNHMGLIIVLALIGFGYYLITEHKAHLIEALPLLLIVGCCVLMHVLMNRTMSMQGPDQKDNEEE